MSDRTRMKSYQFNSFRTPRGAYRPKKIQRKNLDQKSDTFVIRNSHYFNQGLKFNSNTVGIDSSIPVGCRLGFLEDI